MPVLHVADGVTEVIRIGDRLVVMGTNNRLCSEWQMYPDTTTQGQNLMHNQREAKNYRRVMMRMRPLQLAKPK